MSRVRKSFIVHDAEQGGRRSITLIGRDAWALGALINAGGLGCTPIDHPGPRWSHYVYKLRHTYGLNVETLTEDHGPPYSGTHARYVLRQRVEFAEPEAVAKSSENATIANVHPHPSRMNPFDSLVTP